jgi:iron-sulfur cluster assembly protein
MSKRRLIKSAITITENAVARIKYLLNSKKDQTIIGLHLSTKLKGCNGNSYVMNYATEKLKGDEHISYKGIDVYIDNRALFQLVGTTMDFSETQISSEFIFINPNVKDMCGCGESFHI